MKLLTNLIFEPKGKHDPALAYSIKDTVMSADGSQVYFALQDVPAGTALDNEDYWKLQIDLHETKAEMDAAAAAAAGAVSANVDQNLTEVQKATARRNIGLDKVIESLSDPLEASGNPLVVKPVGGMPFGNVVTEFSPKQEGSGDPSPSNIRPISGWDKLNLNAAGKNLLDLANPTRPNTIISANGSFAANSGYNSYRFPAGVGHFAVSFNPGASFDTFRYALEKDGKLTRYTTQKSFVVDVSDADAMWISIDPSGSVMTEVMVELSSSITPFAPYQGNTYTVQIGQTVYGGKFDWLTGKLVAEWAKQNLRATYTITTADGLVYNDFVLENKGFATGVTETTLLCSCLKAKPSFTPGYMYVTDGSSGYFLLADQTLNTTDKVNAYLETLDAQIVYKLATPTTIQLPATEIIALPGTNTLYGDGDTITVTGRQPQTNALESRLAALEAAMTNV
jgi:hypothetical protein